MSARLRSPNYPGTPLGQAIDLTEKLYAQERTNPIDREVAVQGMGYSGITGRSAKVLSDLLQYGLLQKAGKNEVQVSARAVEIMHPDSLESRSAALWDAAHEPELFQRIKEKFPDGSPSEVALRSYFMREGFTDAAIPAAIRAYMDTFQFLEDENVSDSHGAPPINMPKSNEHQRFVGGDQMESAVQPKHAAPRRQSPFMPQPEELVTLNKLKTRTFEGKVYLEALLDVKGLEKLERKIPAIKALISDDEDDPPTPAAEPEPDDDTPADEADWDQIK